MREGKNVILYIDDDPDFRDSMRAVLEAHEYIVAEAATAEEGLRVYHQAKPDLIIVDLMMEEVDAGTHFVKELASLGNRAPIYMLSSVGNSMNLATDPGSLGLAGVLQKPVEPEVLLSVLKTKLKRR
jgi:CheY-like chemotaxis protein